LVPYVYDGIDVIGAEYDSEDERSDRSSDLNETSNESDSVPDEINRKAVALFDFTPENDNEVALVAGQIIWISYRHGQGWLVAEDPKTGEIGLVPEEYVEIYYDNEEIFQDVPRPFLPEILQKSYNSNEENDDEWVDTDCGDEVDPASLSPELEKLKFNEE
jgi:hypothetical protein